MKTTTGYEQHIWTVSFEDTRGNETRQNVAGTEFEDVYEAAKKMVAEQKFKLCGIVRGGAIIVLDAPVERMPSGKAIPREISHPDFSKGAFGSGLDVKA